TSLIGMNKRESRIQPYSEAAKEKKIFKEGLYPLAGILGAAQEDGDIAESGL
ncbi:MAG: ATP-dependent 6-phosphofructokinase, partial [Dialister invisus]|nr:ATP-dependent 6-phosphofructokinase [Dialister invisus]